MFQRIMAVSDVELIRFISLNGDQERKDGKWKIQFKQKGINEKFFSPFPRANEKNFFLAISTFQAKFRFV